MRRTLRIALTYLGRRGGIAQYTLELARALQSMCDLSCHLSTYNLLRPQFERLKCPVRFYETYTGGTSFALRSLTMLRPLRIAKSIASERPDFVLDSETGPWGNLVRRITPSLPWVCTIHDAVLHEGRVELLRRTERLLFPIGANVRALVGVSAFTAAILSRRFPAKPIIASRLGITCGDTAPDLDSVVARRKHFVFFGRIEPYKGVPVLVDAFEIALKHESDLRLTICGSGNIPSRVVAKMNRLGVRLRNEWVPEDEVGKIFSDGGVLVLPYLTATQSGVASIALARALPSIATNVGALPEQVIDRVSGRIVPAGDSSALAAAMVEIAASEEIARTFAAGTMRHAQMQYAWKTIAADLISDLSRLARR